MMKLTQVSRSQAKIKMALQGPSGAGKTMSALLIAYGLCGAWEKIAVIDTENKSANLYEHLGKYWVLPLSAPFTPERYIQALNVCLSAGMKVIVLDSISHEWEGLGGMLAIHSAMTGNSYTNWAKLTPRHDAFIQSMLQADAHIIATMRSKQDYVLVDKNGKAVPEKVGMKPMVRDNTEYEFTLVLEMDIAHMAKASKDRTELFAGKPEFIPSVDTGTAILQWCSQGAEPEQKTTSEIVLQKVAASKTVSELTDVYNAYPLFQQQLLTEFTKRRQELTSNNITNHQNRSQNGIHH